MVILHDVGDGDDTQCLEVFPKKYIILIYYILSAWWIHLLEKFGPYIIQPGEIEQVLLMTTNLMDLGYTYTRLR